MHLSDRANFEELKKNSSSFFLFISVWYGIKTGSTFCTLCRSAYFAVSLRVHSTALCLLLVIGVLAVQMTGAIALLTVGHVPPWGLVYSLSVVLFHTVREVPIPSYVSFVLPHNLLFVAKLQGYIINYHFY